MTKTTCGHEPHYAKGLCMKCYNQRPERKEYKKEYNQRPERKEYKKEYMKEYNQRPEVKKKYRKGGQYFRSDCSGVNKLAKELEKYEWLTEKGKEAMMLDGECLKAELKKHGVEEESEC